MTCDTTNITSQVFASKRINVPVGCLRDGVESLSVGSRVVEFADEELTLMDVVLADVIEETSTDQSAEGTEWGPAHGARIAHPAIFSIIRTWFADSEVAGNSNLPGGNLIGIL